MSATASIRTPQAESSRRRPPTVTALAMLFGLLAIGAIQGGVAMVRDPLRPLGMSTDFLERAPIDTYFLPGIFLLAIAAASVLTLFGMLFDWRWAWATKIEMFLGYRWPWLGAITTAGVLLAFEIVELYIVPFQPIMHPTLIIASLVMLGLAVAPATRGFLRASDD